MRTTTKLIATVAIMLAVTLTAVSCDESEGDPFVGYFDDGGFKGNYVLLDGTLIQVEVTEYTGDKSSLILPTSVNTGHGELKVTSIDPSVLSEATTITVPDGYNSSFFTTNSGLFSKLDSDHEVTIRMESSPSSEQLVDLVGTLGENVDIDFVKNPEYVFENGYLVDDGTLLCVTSWATSDIPDTVKEFSIGVFANSTLTSITIPSGMKSIAGAFQGMTTLESVTFATSPDSESSLTSIGNYTFANSGLKSISIPEGVQTIGINAFNDCESLTSIDLPSSIQTSTELPSWTFPL